MFLLFIINLCASFSSGNLFWVYGLKPNLALRKIVFVWEYTYVGLGIYISSPKSTVKVSQKWSPHTKAAHERRLLVVIDEWLTLFIDSYLEFVQLDRAVKFDALSWARVYEY